MRRLLALSALAVTMAGCGPNAPKPSDVAQVRVTTAFGSQVLLEPPPAQLGQADRQLAFLQQVVPGVRTQGDEVTEISGQRGAWRLWVNGLRPLDLNGDPEQAKDAGLHGGDRIWWDRDAEAATRAVVGAFPEPFRRGTDGRRLPTRVECQEPDAPVCDTVAARLRTAGAIVGRGSLQGSLVGETVRVQVGAWPVLREDDGLQALERGPRQSGVHARPSADGKRIALLDGDGQVVRTLGPGSGLIAAVWPKQGAPTWFVTGTDARGISRAAEALTERDLAGAFALALDGTERISLPVVQG